MTRFRSGAQRFYRRLLRLYPAEFRGEFRTEMVRQFGDEYREAEDRSARRRFVLRAVLDVLATAPVELARALRQDLRFALRVYRKSPGNTAIAVAVLAIGMAFVSAFVSLYVDLAMKPFPGIEDSGRIATLGQGDGVRFRGIPVALIDRITDDMTSVQAVSGVTPVNMPIGPDRLMTTFEMVTNGFFDGINPRLALGRGFDRADHRPEAERVIVISDRYWRQHYGARRDVLGEMLDVGSFQPNEDGQLSNAFRIVGVMAPEMRGALGDDIAFWVPFERIATTLSFGGSFEQLRARTSLFALARLSPGASAATVASELEGLYGGPNGSPGFGPGFRLVAVKGVVRDIGAHRSAERQLRMFLAGSVLLAIVAAANVSLFLLARAPGRQRELAIRMAVGATVMRVTRQLVCEAGFLVLVSAALGLLLAVWLANVLSGFAFLRDAELTDATLLDWKVLGASAVILSILALLVSLAPVLGLNRLRPAPSSRQVAARATLAQQIAGSVQIAVAGAVTAAAIAFCWFLGSIVLGDPGYAIEDRYFVQYQPDGNDFDLLGVRETIESLPGVRGVTLTTAVPGWRSSLGLRPLRHPGDATQQVQVATDSIDGRFVDVLGLRLLHGRAPSDGETDVALVNQAFAQQIFGRHDVVGESLDLTDWNFPRMEITGILADVSFTHPAAVVEPTLFINRTSPQNLFVVDSPLPVSGLRTRLQSLIDSGDLGAGELSVTSLRDLRNGRIAPDSARALLTIATAALVALLAAFGYYGTQHYLVAAGRREYAIRASLGAGPKALSRLLFLRGLTFSLPGLVVGGLLAFAIVGWLRNDYVSGDVSPGLVTLWVVVALIALLLGASLSPAREARSTRPAPLLRED